MAFVLYLLYLCSVILFLYIRTILMESILITGASGFIGSYLVKALVDKGHEVLCLKGTETKVWCVGGNPF